MSATAIRVCMPANNWVHRSATLQTNNIWQSMIGYDPYAPNKEKKKIKPSQKSSSAPEEPEPENAYANFYGMLPLDRITGSNTGEAHGACKKCGRVGKIRCGPIGVVFPAAYAVFSGKLWVCDFRDECCARHDCCRNDLEFLSWQGVMVFGDMTRTELKGVLEFPYFNNGIEQTAGTQHTSGGFCQLP